MLMHSEDLRRKESLSTVVSILCNKLLFLQAQTSKDHNNILYMDSATLAVEMMRQGKRESLKMTFSTSSTMYLQRT